ncbi:MAG TPA: AAA family ATPase, partial [Lacipirellulaceae bacterium]|nr:AAA family ATPase [Lacipirellulaceae bacterium]
MKITDLKIEGFGVWRELVLRGLSPELTVFYGPNEAGKSTLMQFMRSVLYGVSPIRRERYMPPVNGGRPGGWLKVQTDGGPLTINRYADRGPKDVGKVTIVTADGEEQGDRLLREALEHVDEPTYNNIFAVGLREVQELGSLSDTAAAQWLYRLTSGLDRISLYDVIHMLEGTRLRLLNSWEEKSELRTLLSRQEQLRGELDELVAKGRRWAQSAVRLRELAEEVNQRQAEAKAIAARGRRLEVAINIKPLWVKRAKLDDQLERFTNLQLLEEGTIAALDDFNKRIEDHERQRDILKGQRQQLRDEARRLGINEVLVRNGARLEALLEQQDWLQSVERMSAELADEVRHLEARLASENERLSHEWTGAGKIPPRITSDIVEQLTPQARAIEATEQMVASAKHELEIRRSGHEELGSQIESAMVTGEKLGLPKDVESAGDLVAQLKHRQQIEKQIAAAHRQADELQAEANDLVEEQVVPMGLFVFLTAMFMSGFVALAAWWYLPATILGKYAGWIAVGGIAGSLIAFLVKFLTETSASDRFDSCHHQIESALDQIDEFEAERAKLDQELSLHGGPVAQRLQHAEQHLAELERILPVESQRREVAQEIESIERRLKLAEEKHAAAAANWKGRL